MSEQKKMDVGFIRSGEDMHLTIFGMPDDVQVRFTFWDYDAERLYPLTPQGTTEQEIREFFQIMHERMQRWDADGGMATLRQNRLQAERIRQLEDQLRIATAQPKIAVAFANDRAS